MNRYRVIYSQGTNIHDVETFVGILRATDFADAGQRAEFRAARRANTTVQSITKV